MATERDCGSIEAAARADIAKLGDLSGMQATLAQTAYRLAAALDSGATGMALSATAKELRETLAALLEDNDTENEIKRLLLQLATPVSEDGGL